MLILRSNAAQHRNVTWILSIPVTFAVCALVAILSQLRFFHVWPLILWVAEAFSGG